MVEFILFPAIRHDIPEDLKQRMVGTFPRNRTGSVVDYLKAQSAKVNSKSARSLLRFDRSWDPISSCYMTTYVSDTCDRKFVLYVCELTHPCKLLLRLGVGGWYEVLVPVDSNSIQLDETIPVFVDTYQFTRFVY